jgi:hypothetical protein
MTGKKRIIQKYSCQKHKQNIKQAMQSDTCAGVVAHADVCCMPHCPLLAPGEPKPRPPPSCPLLAFGEPEPRPPLRPLVHWVPGLGSVECLAERITFAEFASLSCPEFPDGTVSRPPPCGPRTPGLAELQGPS